MQTLNSNSVSGNIFPRGKLLLETIQKVYKAILDFIFPPICLLCPQKPNDDGYLCPDCFKKLMDQATVQINETDKDFKHLQGKRYFDQVITCWEYSPNIEKLVHQVKYRGWRKLGVYLGCLMGGILKDVLNGDKVVLIPVPLHHTRKRERGFNQGDLISQGLSESLGIPIAEKVLKRRKNTKTQTKLAAEERSRNVIDAFRIRSPESIENKTVFLVDDVCTTGSTMNSCAQVLKSQKVKKVIGVALTRPLL